MTTIEQWQAGRSVPGAPPWDGTGVPFPVDENGWPDVDPGPDPVPIVVTPGSVQTVASTDPLVEADPTTAWTADQHATFTDGEFTWDGDSWEPWTAPVTAAFTITATPDPLPEDVNADVVITSNVPTAEPTFEFSIDSGTTYSPIPVTEVDAQTWTTGVPNQDYAEGDLLWLQAENGVATPGFLAITVAAAGTPVEDPNLGWTVQELRDFAGDHEPPIVIPSSATTKAQILQVILAYLASHPEEN